MKYLLTASLLLLAISCGNSHTSSFIEIVGAPGMEIGYGPLTLKFDETITYHNKTEYDSDTGTSSESTINGMNLSFRETTLCIGDTCIEGLNAGDIVELSKAGIVVNGEVRAAMPEAGN